MKYRESDMPDEDLWNTFFEPRHVLSLLEVDETVQVLIDIGCGYGTFLFPAAESVKEAIGIDIDRQMIEFCTQKAEESGCKNVTLIEGDISQGSTMRILHPYFGKVDYITLFNMLHCETPHALLRSSYDILKPGGKIGVIHWKQEDTPRGPSMEIRPTPERIIEWASDTGLKLKRQIDVSPYHYGLVFIK